MRMHRKLTALAAAIGMALLVYRSGSGLYHAL